MHCCKEIFFGRIIVARRSFLAKSLLQGDLFFFGKLIVTRRFVPNSTITTYAQDPAMLGRCIVALSVESCTWHSIDLDAFQFYVNEASYSGGEKIKSNRIMQQWFVAIFVVVLCWPDTQGGGSPWINCVMLVFIDAGRSFAWELFMRKVLQYLAGVSWLDTQTRWVWDPGSPWSKRRRHGDGPSQLILFNSLWAAPHSQSSSPSKKTILFRSALQKRELELKLERQE